MPHDPMTNNPPRVDEELYWTEPPPVESPRCAMWREKIRAGWRPNRRVSGLGYHCKAEFYGVYIWEYINVISPLLDEMRKQDALPDEPHEPSE